MVSVVIPARNERFLQQTIEDLLSKASGAVEVIAVLDGYWPDPPLRDDPRLRVIHRGEARGMRAAINDAVAISNGEYILKADAHTLWDKGWDEKLVADCEDNWVVVPRRKRLDAENWCIQETDKPDIDYHYLSYPDDPRDFGGSGLNGKTWDERNRRTDEFPEIDDLLSSQGSAWFMKRSYFYELELMDEASYGKFWNEFQEIGLKCWLSGGRVVVNKKTWYAHLHKGKKYGRGYFLPEDWLTHGRDHTIKWMKFGKAWHKQKYPIEWLINKFGPVPGWPVPKQIDNPGNRYDMINHFKDLGLKVGAEIGVERAIFTVSLCRRFKMYAIDPWKAYKGYRDHVTQEKLDRFYQETVDRLAKYDVQILRKTSMEALADIPDESLDFVYIDGNHEFQFVANDICEWTKKVRKGGVVSGHDFIRSKGHKYQNDVKSVVEAYAYTKGRQLTIWRGDKNPSWSFVK